MPRCARVRDPRAASEPRRRAIHPTRCRTFSKRVKLTGALFFLVDARTPWVAEAPASADLAPAILPHAQHVVSYHVVSRGSLLV